MKWNAKKQPSILTFFEINFFFYPYVLHIKQKNTSSTVPYLLYI